MRVRWAMIGVTVPRRRPEELLPLPAVRRFVVFPDQPDLVPSGASRLTPFQCLIAFESGVIAHFVTQRRDIPSAEEYRELDFVIRDMSRYGWTPGHATQVAVDEYGFDLELVDSAFERLQDWMLELHLAAALTNLVLLQESESPGRVRGALREAASARLNDALADFVRHLDQNIVDRLGRTTPILPSHYNYFGAGDPSIRRNRLQANENLPIVFRYFTDHSQPSPLVSALSRAVDDGSSLTDTLRRRAGMSTAVARSVLSCPVEVVIRPWKWDLGNMAKFVAMIEPAFRPKTTDQWIGLHDVSRTLVKSLKLSDKSEALKRWLNDAASDEFQLRDDANDRLLSMSILVEMVDAVAEVAAEHYDGDINLLRDTVLNALSRKRLHSALASARSWQAAFEREQEIYVSKNLQSSGIEWPAPVTAFRTEDRVMMPILTPEDLFLEGTTMRHCVGTYANSCACGDIQIWSVRTLTEERCSTLATKFDDEAGRIIDIVQHHSRDNGPPDQDSAKAAIALCEFLTKDEQDFSEFHTWRNLQPRRTENLSVHLPIQQISRAAVVAAVPELLRVALDKSRAQQESWF